jgi:N-acetylglucosaminyldiphosphoundecaprenol N-acetyl-beta-D-mannosaminyltransferase
MKIVSLFGIPICDITLDEALDLIRHCVTAGSSSKIFLCNAHTVNLARDDAEFREVLLRGTYVLPDGVGVRIAGLLCGRRLKPDFNPTDLYPRLCQSLQETGVRVFLLGGEPGIAERAKAKALAEFPGLLICGTHHGYFSPEDEERVIGTIRDSRADILLVGMGQPKQEKWIGRNLELTGAKVGMGVGALFDYHAGKIKRAPVWMRRLGLEWLGRLIPGMGEPRRLWRRYLLGNFRFLWFAVLHAIERRSSMRAPCL